jgi:hypothetical protein
MRTKIEQRVSLIDSKPTLCAQLILLYDSLKKTRSKLSIEEMSFAVYFYSVKQTCKVIITCELM